MEGAAAEGAREIARLEARMGEDPGAPAFPALAEAHRRSGDAKRAEQVAREGLARDPESAAGRVALALALLERGAAEEARAELERVLERVADHPRARATLAEVEGAAPEAREGDAALAGIGDAEVESAFEDAEARAEEMVDANHVAEATMRSVEAEAPPAAAPAPAEEGAFEAEAGSGVSAPGSPFATRTMAGLLERQGYGDEARRLRDSLEAGAPAARDAPAAGGEEASADASPARRKERVLAVLERWLAHLRRAPR